MIYVFEDYRLDVPRRMLYRGDAEIALAPKAIETLLALIDGHGEIVSKRELIETIWTDTIVEESNLQHYLYVLRKTLGTRRDGKPFIETFRRRGYRFTAEVRTIGEVSAIEETSAPQTDGSDRAPIAEAKIPHLADWKNENSPAFLDDRKAAGSLEVGKPPSVFQNRQLLSAAVVFSSFFALATFLYYQFQPAKIVSQSNARGEVSVTPLTNGYVVLSATVSPDGKYFVYHDEEGGANRLWLQQTGQVARVEIVPTAERTIGGKTFSPNGEFVYFVSREKGESKFALYRVPTLGGAPTKILDDVEAPVSFSPDGREMVFVRNAEKTKRFQLVIAPADGGEESVLLAGAESEIFSSGSAWSPDGKSVAFGSIVKNSPSGEGNCSLAAIEVQTGAVKRLSPEKWDTCFRMAWTPDGEGVVFIGTQAGESYTTRRDQVYYLSVATGQSRRVTTDGSRYQDQSLGVTANNSILAVPSKMLSQIWATDSDGDFRTAVQLTTGQADGRSGIAPLPDGRVGYIARVGDSLSVWIMNADGTNQRQIYNRLPFVEELRATPDGRYFIFSARRDGFSHLYRIDVAGGNFKQLTDGQSYELDSTVSPDGRWVYYGSDFTADGGSRTQLRKTAIESGETVVLKDLDASNLVPDVSPDGKVIAGYAGSELKLFSAADGALVKTLKLDKMAQMASGAKWTPDGRALTYLVYRDNGVNVWRQSPDDRAPQRLTTFLKGYVYFHAFSRDGKRLYVAYGYQVRDALLISDF